MNGDDIPVYLRWFRYISYPYYSFRLLMINEFSDHTYPCPFADEAAAAAAQALAANTTLPLQYSPQAVAAQCALFDGNNVLQGQGINDHGTDAPIAGCFVAIFVFHFIAYLFLRFVPQHPAQSTVPPPPPPAVCRRCLCATDAN